MIEAWHLPGLQSGDVEGWETRTYGAVSLRFPVLRTGAPRRIAEHITRARDDYLADLPAREIARRIDAAAARLDHPDDPLRHTADVALPAITGYSPEMLALSLRRSIVDWRAPALENLLHADLPHPDALDQFVARPGCAALTRGFAPRLTFHVFAGNVPGVAVTAIVRALLVKSAPFGKTASGEPLLPVLFARALANVDARLAQCIAVTYWPGGDPIEAEILAAAEAVVAYGGPDTLTSLRSRMPPGLPLIDHGPRISFGLVGRAALESPSTATATASAAALATATFDQQGCVSPHLLYVETGAPVTPEAFARLVAAQLQTLAGSLPRATLSPAEAAAILDARATAEFRAISGEDTLLLADKDTSTTVILDPRPDFEPSPLNRVLRIKPVPTLLAVPPLLAPFRHLLQTAAIAGAAHDTHTLASMLARAGVTRITTFDAMPWPPPTWHHDGRGPLSELVRWVDLEV